MQEGFELIETIIKRIDDVGYLDLTAHLDRTSNSTAPSNRDFYFEVAYQDSPANVVATSNSVTVRHMEPIAATPAPTPTSGF